MRFINVRTKSDINYVVVSNFTSQSQDKSKITNIAT